MCPHTTQEKGGEQQGIEEEGRGGDLLHGTNETVCADIVTHVSLG